tara:strand:- start:15 stop:665 length:651 start_codon:yes stop_codon:yes gene_type:complete
MTYSLDDIASTGDYKDGLPSTRTYDIINLGKPGPDDWFRLYALKDREPGLLGFQTTEVAKKKDADGKAHPYLIAGSPEFRATCLNKFRGIQLVRLCYGITSTSSLFIWPVVVVEDLNSAIGWHQSGHEIADAACSRWTQLVSDKANSRYTHIDLDDQSSVPNKPEFTTPPVDYKTAIFKAFKGRIIDSEDHPVYKNAGSVVQTTYSKNKLVGSVKN